MKPTVEQLLQKHYVDGVFHTHVSMIQPKGRFQFNREGLENFWDAYCRLLQENSDAIVGVAEKPQTYLPVLVDVDIKLLETEDGDLGDHVYKEHHVNQVIDAYQTILQNIVEGCTDDHLLCVVLEKPLYRITKGETTYVKNGFHLHFPNLFLSRADQEVHLIPRVKQILLDNDSFGDIGVENSSTVIDDKCCGVHWLMYGSRKSEDMQPYRVTRVITSEGEEVSLEEAFSTYQLFDKQERLVKIAGRVEELLPRILSIIPYSRQASELRPNLVCPLKEKMKKDRPNSDKTYDKLSSEKALKISAKLLPLLGDFRANDRNEWLTIGWILFNISDGGPEGLQQWSQFSQRCEDKYDEATCIHEWGKMVRKDLTLGTLHYYAKQDNPEGYAEYKRERVEMHKKEALGGSHNDIAKILHAEYGSDFVCSSVLNRTWYQFVNHGWEEIELGVVLRAKISDEIAPMFVDLGQKLFAESCNSDKPAQAALMVKVKQSQKIVERLKTAPFKDNVMKECMEVFYDRRFRSKLNTNPYLIRFQNGVLDLSLNIFRAGRPEDFISKSLPINYVEFPEGDERVLEVHRFLEKVFPDKSVRDYFLDNASDVFVGGNTQKKVFFWTGEGDNGKSVTQLFFEKMLGEMAIKFNTTLVTGKKTATGNANPELARAGDGVRWATMEEPDGDEQLNIGILKAISGNDSFWARDLFEKGKSTREITPMFKFIFICNKLPKLKYSDQATWNRFRVIPFESTFVAPGKPCPATYEEQLKQKRFPMDKHFSEKIPGMVEPFAWVLLQHRLKLIRGDVVRHEPEKVTQATAVYRKQNDVYRQFIEECIVEDNYTISLTEIYAHFKEWHREGFPNHSVPIKNEIKEYFDKLWGEGEKGCRWKGHRIRTLQDDVDDGSAIVLGEDDLVEYDDEVLDAEPMDIL